MFLSQTPSKINKNMLSVGLLRRFLRSKISYPQQATTSLRSLRRFLRSLRRFLRSLRRFRRSFLRSFLRSLRRFLRRCGGS